MNTTANRHPSTVASLQRLEVNQNLSPAAQKLASDFYKLGASLVNQFQDDPDLTEALRKLWEAKNYVVWLVVKASK